MLMILARLVRSESFWAVVKVRSPHTGREPGYPRLGSPAHEAALAVRVQRVLLCTRRALHAARSAARAA